MSGQRGSIPLALLVAIMVAAMIAIVAAATLAGERSTRFDQRFTGALHVAETGAHDALHLLNTGQMQPGQTGSGTSDGDPYEWEAEAFIQNDSGDYERVPSSGSESFANLSVEARDIDKWLITSQGSMSEVTRSVELDVAVRPLFALAAFTDQLMDLAGTNVADSYMSLNTGSHEREWCTGEGRMGTNDIIEFGGGGGEAVCPYADADGSMVWTDRINSDGVDLYDWENDPDPQRCDQDAQADMNNCWWTYDDPRFTTHDEYRDLEADVAWLDEAVAQCSDADLNEDFVVSQDHTGQGTDDEGNTYYELGPATATSDNSYETPFANDVYYYCYGSVTFDENTVITGSLDDPVFIVSDGPVEFERSSGPRRVVVNCHVPGSDPINLCNVHEDGWDPTDAYSITDGAGSNAVYPDAGGLQIFTTASSGTAVHVRQQSAVAAAIYAHKGSCGGAAGSNTSVDIFGALICGEMVNAGGWRFHYDEALRNFVAVPNYAVDSWRER